MTERILNSKTFISFMLAAITWTVLHSLYPFPAGNLYLQLISYKDPAVYSAIFWIYSLMMFTTPFIIYSSVFSGIYTFAYRHGRTPKAVPLPLYPDPRSRDSLYLVLSEVHHPTKPIPSPAPYCFTIPDRSLFTGIASLLNNLFGRGKEPFWQQAYTNLVKFIILLHKVAYDYVTLFHIYECTISPSVLERKIAQAELAIPSEEYMLLDGKSYKQLQSNPANKVP